MSVRYYNIKELAAGIAMMFAASSFVYAADFVTSDHQHYHVSADGKSAELTYSAYDSTNVSVYQGDVIVPASVTCDGVNYLVNGVTPFACVYCDSLRSVTLPEGITRIGFGAFSDCPNLASVLLPASLVTLSDWSFYRDASLSVATIPGRVSRVGACSFAFCTSLDSLSMPVGLKAIGQNAFYYCTSLTHLYLPGSVCQIGEYAFAYDSSLREIVTDGSPVAITTDVFEGVDVANVRLVVPSSLVEAYRNAEVWCDFQIVDGGSADLKEIPADGGLSENDFHYRVANNVLYLYVNGDAPALVYDLQGQRIAVAASHSGETQIPLSCAYYIIRCGRKSYKIGTLR